MVGCSDLKTLSASDFEMWRTELKSFISERQGGAAAAASARRIYVVADGSKDLVSVDLTPVFTHSDRVSRSIGTLQKEAAALATNGTYFCPIAASATNHGARELLMVHWVSVRPFCCPQVTLIPKSTSCWS